MSKPVTTATSWQYVDEDHAVTFVDKLIGVEVQVHRFDSGETPIVSGLVPPDHVGSLIQALMRFGMEGNVAISRRADTERAEREVASILAEIDRLGWEPHISDVFDRFMNCYPASAKRKGTAVAIYPSPHVVHGDAPTRLEAARTLLEAVQRKGQP